MVFQKGPLSFCHPLHSTSIQRPYFFRNFSFIFYRPLRFVARPARFVSRSVLIRWHRYYECIVMWYMVISSISTCNLYASVSRYEFFIFSVFRRILITSPSRVFRIIYCVRGYKYTAAPPAYRTQVRCTYVENHRNGRRVANPRAWHLRDMES